MSGKWSSREKVISYLEDYSSNIKEQINSKKTKNSLLKSYIFETFNENIHDVRKMSKINVSMKSLFLGQDGYDIRQIDEEMYCLLKEDNTVGFLEQIDKRFVVLYSLENSDIADRYARDIVRESAVLDSLWVSGKMFDRFLHKISNEQHPSRYTKIKFEFNSFFEANKYNKSRLDHSEDLRIDLEEHKASAVSLTEEVGQIFEKVKGVRKYFSSFHAIGQLRFPSTIGRGGHDFYRNGKVTNRSDNFKDHRFQVKQLVGQYKEITEILEYKTWIDFERITSPNKQYLYNYEGSPVAIEFKEPLKEAVFKGFINYTFPKGREPFRILGEVIEVREDKFHVYGIDLHLWQRIMMELTQERFILFLPKGTCGNTIHRLVTNIQRFLTPELTVHIGNYDYEDIISEVVEKRG